MTICQICFEPITRNPKRVQIGVCRQCQIEYAKDGIILYANPPMPFAVLPTA